MPTLYPLPSFPRKLAESLTYPNLDGFDAELHDVLDGLWASVAKINADARLSNVGRAHEVRVCVARAMGALGELRKTAEGQLAIAEVRAGELEPEPEKGDARGELRRLAVVQHLTGLTKSDRMVALADAVKAGDLETLRAVLQAPGIMQRALATPAELADVRRTLREMVDPEKAREVEQRTQLGEAAVRLVTEAMAQTTKVANATPAEYRELSATRATHRRLALEQERREADMEDAAELSAEQFAAGEARRKAAAAGEEVAAVSSVRVRVGDEWVTPPALVGG